MSPRELGLGLQTDKAPGSYAPLARAIIGGLTVSVVLTVFVVPAAYLMVYRKRRLNPSLEEAGK